MKIEDIRAALNQVSALPLEEAQAMPAAFYTSDDFLALERDELFVKEWVCIGHLSELADTGDYFTYEVAGEELVAIRGKGGTVRVLSNVCRHRANLIARGRGKKARRLVCPYHAWSYGLDGALKSAPFMEEKKNFRCADHALPEIRSEIWQDFIFINLDGRAPPLASQCAPFLKHVKNYHQEGRAFHYVAEEEWATNWKCLVENFMEGYHLSAAHAKTLHPITPTRLCTRLDTPLGMAAYTSGYDPAVPERGPFHPDLTEEERRRSCLFAIFPALCASFVPNVTLYLIVRPIATDRVGVKWGLAGTVDDPNHPDVIRYRDLCIAFNAEDKDQLEHVQRGMMSRFYEPGPLGPANYEGTIWDFYQFMADRLGGPEKRVVKATSDSAA